MIKKQLIAVGILSICLFAAGCGSSTTDVKQNTEPVVDVQTAGTQEKETETQGVRAETQEAELSELEKKMEEFNNNILAGQVNMTVGNTHRDGQIVCCGRRVHLGNDLFDDRFDGIRIQIHDQNLFPINVTN